MPLVMPSPQAQTKEYVLTLSFCAQRLRAALMGGGYPPGMSADSLASLHMQQLLMEQQLGASSGMPASMYSSLPGMMMRPGTSSAPLSSQALQHFLMHGGGGPGIPMPMPGLPPAVLARLQAGGGLPPGLSPSQLMQMGMMPPSQVRAVTASNVDGASCKFDICCMPLDLLY